MEHKDIKEIDITRIKKKFKEHLQKSKIEQTTINTRMTDSFYILNNSDEDIFFNIVFSNNFEFEAKEKLLSLLNKQSNANPEKAVHSYLSHLRSFRDFVISYDSNIYDEKDDIEAIKNFLLDIKCLDSLSEWTSKFNMFDVLKISRAEIRHSNMLAWLLDPNENHGLGDDIIRRFVQYVVSSFSNDDEIFEILLKDYDDFNIQREWHHIDILAISQKEKLILCIENKIGTSEHDNQLDRYKKEIDEYYPDFKTLYIYLSPNGEEASDSGNWCSMSYQDVLDIIELSRNKKELIPEVKMLVDNYVEAIRRDVMGDEKLVNICSEIYKKHKRAIDLIIENKPDRASELTEIFVKWAKDKTNAKEIEVDLSKCIKTYTRFKTKNMSEILPDTAESNSGWNTKNHYFYEIINNNGNEYFIQFAMSSENLPQDLKEKCERINELYPSKQQKQNWKWKTCFKTKNKKLSDSEEYDEEKIRKQLDEFLKDIITFEEELKLKI